MERAKKVAPEQDVRWRRAIEALTPLNRVHAGPDMMRAYRILQDFYPDSELFGYASGGTCGTWVAPSGWQVHKATLTDPSGKVVVDWEKDHVLSLFSYSPSFTGEVSKGELEKHLFSNPDRPESYPFFFRNQYLPEKDRNWGFCIPDRMRENLPDGDYTVDIQTEYTKDPMEMVLQSHIGESEESLLLVGHFDHPGQCGDGLLGCVAGHEIITRLQGRKTRLTYRMLSTVEIVGSVFYCGDRAQKDRVKEAMFCALSGVNAPLVYSQSVGEKSAVDRAARHVLACSVEGGDVIPFREAIGNDEIAFDVRGVDIPCGSLMRWPYEFYHTSDDTAGKALSEKFEDFVEYVIQIIDIFEQNASLEGTFIGLPYLSHPDIGLYLSPPSMSGVQQEPNATTRAVLERLPTELAARQAVHFGDRFNYMMTLLPGLADGKTTTLDLAERSGVPFAVVHAYTELWVEKGLLRKTWVNPFERKENKR
jgi:aminopeptidase-like protein